MNIWSSEQEFLSCPSTLACSKLQFNSAVNIPPSDSRPDVIIPMDIGFQGKIYKIILFNSM